MRFSRMWRYVRLALIAFLVFLLIIQLVAGNWSSALISAILLALLSFLEAIDRGWIPGVPPPNR